jgi:zinc protease
MKKSSSSGKWLLLFLVGFGWMESLLAQTAMEAVLLPDPAVKIGKLENGLTYYIRQNKKPENKVELRLALNAGSINEDDDQLGLAHMAEHMAFNGTKNFKKNELISFLQDIGVGFGNDLNAYTSFDETVYMLPIPTDKPGNLEKGFQVLEDWAHQVTYLDEDIESERAIILEESRLGKGAQDRMMRQVYPKLFAGSKYAVRLPIGSEPIIKNFKPDLIRRYYKEWYRPNLMAVLVVGDVDPVKAEELIKKHFAGLKNPVNERKRELVKIPAYASNEAIVVTDKEATGYSITLNYPIKEAKEDPTVSGYRRNLVRQLFSSMLNQRLQELTQQANPPFVGAGAGFGEFVRGHENFRAVAFVGTGEIKKGLDALSTELQRVYRYGFIASELDRSKKTLLNSMERSYNNRDKTESQVWVDEYVRNFLTGEVIPGIEKEFQLTKEVLPGIGLDELNAMAKNAMNDSNLLVYVTGPESAAAADLPTENELLTIVADNAKKTINPYVENEVSTSLLATLPKAGKLLKTEKDAKMGSSKITLSNGVVVTLKPTAFKNDQILMGAVKNGGRNLYGVGDKYNAQFAVQVVSSMGVGNFTPADLKKALAGKTVNLTPSIGEVTDGFNGSSGNKDIETLLQLAHLYITQPRKDTALFSAYKQRSIAQYAALSSNPQAAFLDTLNQIMYNNNPLAPIVFPKVENFKEIKLDRVMEIYRERMGDATGMQFVFVGSFREEELIPLLETYLGSLPVSGRKVEKKDNKVRPVTGKKELVVRKGKEQKSLILNFYTGELPYSQEMELKANAIAEILNIRVIEELREKIQGIYGGGFFAEVTRYPYPNYSFVLQLPCGPEKVDTLLKAVQSEIDWITKKGPDTSYLNKVKKQWLEQYKTSQKENGRWLQELLGQVGEGNDPAYFLQYEQMVNKLTVKDIQLAAQKLFNGKNIFSAVLMPEN